MGLVHVGVTLFLEFPVHLHCVKKIGNKVTNYSLSGLLLKSGVERTKIVGIVAISQAY